MNSPIVRGLIVLALAFSTTYCARSTDFVFKMPEATQEKASGVGPGSIEGDVTDPAGVAIPDVAVVVRTATGTVVGEGISNANGHYVVNGLGGLPYNVDYNSSVYHSLTNVRMTVVNERATIFNVVLSKRPGRVSGRVTDAATGLPLEQASVEIRTNSLSPVILASTFTNARGEYTVTGLAEGEYAVNFSLADYIPVVGVPLRINPGRETRLDQRLTSVYGSLRGKVTQAAGGAALPNVKVSVRDQGVLPVLLETVTDRNGNYSFARLREGPYSVDFEVAGYFPIFEVGTTINAGQVTVLNQAMGSAGSGLRGRVTNAVNGAPVFQATVTVRSENPDAPATASTRTDTDGTYMFPGLPAGRYLVDFTKEGFFPILMVPAELPPGQFLTMNQSMSQKLVDGEYRAVMTWGNNIRGGVRDVDSYLMIPNGRSYAIHYGNRSEDGAELDVDETTWSGPETITINEMRMGTYVYYVNNYNMRCDPQALGRSEIVVNLYSRAGLIKTYRVPEGRGLNYELFRIVDGRVVDSLRYDDSLRYQGGASCNP